MIDATFGQWAETYDRARRQLVPCFDEFYDALVSQIPYENNAELHILDLGAGTGLLSLFVSKRFPKSNIMLVDVSSEMLKKAQERFSRETGRFEFVLADFSQAPLQGPFDAIISALAIHHLVDEHKVGLFRKIYQALAPGGVFLNADQVSGSTPEIEARYHSNWLRQVRARGVTESDLAAAIERMKDDKMATLPAQLSWLEQVGFQLVDCWYKSYNFAVFGGYKLGAS